MEYLSLLFLHLAFGIFWAGAAIAAGLFIIPSVLGAGPAGGAVMAGIVKRRLPTILTIAGSIVVLTGLRLYMLRFSPEWVTTPQGLVLTLGGILGLGGFLIGVFVQRPAAQRLGQLSAQVAAGGGPPTQAQAAELAALRGKLGRVAAVTAWHLIGATLLMASHRLVTAF